MPVQAIPLALAASLYPLGLAAILLLAEAIRPRPKVGVFLIGAGLDGAQAAGRERLA